MKIISREAAKAVGQKTYFTGVDCLNGHSDVRSVANGVCYQCRRDAQNRHRASNLEADRQRSREWYVKNKEHAAAWKRNWVANNPEKYKERRRKYRSTTDGRAIEMMNASKWSANEKGLSFDLDLEWIKSRLEVGACQLTGLAFRLEPLDGGRQNPYTASLDRIIPAKGYIKSNVRMILWALNAAFNSYGEDVYAEIAEVYLARRAASIGTGLT